MEELTVWKEKILPPLLHIHLHESCTTQDIDCHNWDRKKSKNMEIYSLNKHCMTSPAMLNKEALCPEEMAHQIRAVATFAEKPGIVSSTHDRQLIVTCNYSSRTSTSSNRDTCLNNSNFFWPNIKTYESVEVIPMWITTVFKNKYDIWLIKIKRSKRK